MSIYKCCPETVPPRFPGPAYRILEKQSWLQMSQVFSVSAHQSLGSFALQGFYSEAASPNRRCSQRDLEILRSRRSEARPR